jgi:RNA recognition motif. (a.k.a. RRM, RBD, or RNP domain)
MIEAEICSEQKGNNGCCFIVFKTKQDAKDAIINPKRFRTSVITEDLFQRRKLNVDQWDI